MSTAICFSSAVGKRQARSSAFIGPSTFVRICIFIVNKFGELSSLFVNKSISFVTMSASMTKEHFCFAIILIFMLASDCTKDHKQAHSLRGFDRSKVKFLLMCRELRVVFLPHSWRILGAKMTDKVISAAPGGSCADVVIICSLLSLSISFINVVAAKASLCTPNTPHLTSLFDTGSLVVQICMPYVTSQSWWDLTLPLGFLDNMGSSW